jgi:hypothetical protein
VLTAYGAIQLPLYLRSSIFNDQFAIMTRFSILLLAALASSATALVHRQDNGTASNTTSPYSPGTTGTSSSTPGTPVNYAGESPPPDDTILYPEYALPDGSVPVAPVSAPETFTNNSLPDSYKNHGNPPPVVLNKNESIELAKMEIDFFKHFAEHAPAPGDIQLILKTLNCTVDALSLSGVLRRQACTPYTDLNINIYFNYVWDGTVDRRTNQEWEDRISAQMTFLKQAYDPLGIHFTAIPTIQYLKGRFSTNYIDNEASNDKVMAKFHQGGPDDLNVFLVESIHNWEFYDPNTKYNGYSILLASSDLTGDGIVMDQARLGTEAQNTLVHEIGHWMGLEHTFGMVGAYCTMDDGLLDTTRTSGDPTTIFDCFQKRCDNSNTYDRINNWMSYSQCVGTNADNSFSTTAFTTDQKARMFARYLKYRRGISSACNTDPTVSSLEFYSANGGNNARSLPTEAPVPNVVPPSLRSVQSERAAEAYADSETEVNAPGAPPVPPAGGAPGNVAGTPGILMHELHLSHHIARAANPASPASPNRRIQNLPALHRRTTSITSFISVLSMQNLVSGTCPIPGSPIPGTVHAGGGLGPENGCAGGQPGKPASPSIVTLVGSQATGVSVVVGGGQQGQVNYGGAAVQTSSVMAAAAASAAAQSGSGSGSGSENGASGSGSGCESGSANAAAAQQTGVSSPASGSSGSGTVNGAGASGNGSAYVASGSGIATGTATGRPVVTHVTTSGAGIMVRSCGAGLVGLAAVVGLVL